MHDLEDDEIAEAKAPIILKLAQEHCGVRLDKVLSQLVSQYSRSRLQQWIEAGCVLVDGKAARGKNTMLGDETIVVTPQESPDESAFAPEDIPLDVLYEDDTLFIINKPVGLVVHPGAGNWSGTMLNGLLHRTPALASVPRAGIVHRLDKDTSGLMVVARTLEAQTDLVRQMQARTVSREYLALVWGSPPYQGRVDAAIARHPRERIRMAVSRSPMAKPAITHYTTLAEGMIDRHQVSLVRCKLETGRTHQIRVHMQSIGFPLVGDQLYGKAHLAGFFPRQALHAQRLALVHPTRQVEMAWQSEVPADMQELLDQTGIDPDDYT